MEWAVEDKERERERKNAANRAQWIWECEWRDWFAWYPVRVSATKKVWLRSVQRRLPVQHRREQPQWYNWDIRDFEYREAPR